jgi:hypothetical protein
MTTLPLPNILNVLPESADHSRRALTALAPTWFQGREGNRLVVILKAPGCSYDRRASGGCKYCGFSRLTTQGSPVSPANFLQQFTKSLQGEELVNQRVIELDLFNSGNFLNPDEVPVEAQVGLLRQSASLPDLRVVVVESRPEYITEPSLEALHKALPRGPQLEVGIGLDAYDDRLRQRILRKGIPRRAFESAVRRLGSTSTGLLCYVMLKPWDMTNDEASADAFQCAQYAHEVAQRYGVECRIALEPTFVVPGTPLAQLYKDGSYTPPSLWLVVKTLSEIAKFSAVRAGTWDEDLFPLATPSACPDCQPKLQEAITGFNRTQNIALLEGLGSCHCADRASS